MYILFRLVLEFRPTHVPRSVVPFGRGTTDFLIPLRGTFILTTTSLRGQCRTAKSGLIFRETRHERLYSCWYGIRATAVSPANEHFFLIFSLIIVLCFRFRPRVRFYRHALFCFFSRTRIDSAPERTIASSRFCGRKQRFPHLVSGTLGRPLFDSLKSAEKRNSKNYRENYGENVETHYRYFLNQRERRNSKYSSNTSHHIALRGKLFYFGRTQFVIRFL